MSVAFLFWPILLPFFAAVLVLFTGLKEAVFKPAILLFTTLVNLILSIVLWGNELSFSAPWGGFGMDFSLRLYHFNSVILLAVAALAFLICLYSVSFLQGKDHRKRFYFYCLLTLCLVNGAVLANNLLVLIFFWMALMIPVYGILLSGGRDKYPTAMRALVLNASADLCLMLGIAITGHLAGTLMMDRIYQMPLNFAGGFGFVCMVLGALGKAGAMPFYAWLPDASVDVPVPFMAFFPSALEKLLGVYLLIRIGTDFYHFIPGSGLSIAFMVLGCITLLLAVVISFVQKNFKMLLTFNMVSQVGYIVLGIGTALPMGMIGGLFHAINQSMWQSTLFLTAGAVERSVHTSDLRKLGGLRKEMPLVFACFVVAALAAVGMPPLSGFFSNQLILKAALQAGIGYYLVALLGIFCMAASFLRLGHAVFFGPDRNYEARETPPAMWIPMAVLAFGGILFGVYNALPLRHILQPVLTSAADYSGLPGGYLLGAATLLVLLLAGSNHIHGFRKSGCAVEALDHITGSVILRKVYKTGGKRYFDPYEILMTVFNSLGRAALAINQGLDWLYEKSLGRLVIIMTKGMRG